MWITNLFKRKKKKSAQVPILKTQEYEIKEFNLEIWEYPYMREHDVRERAIHDLGTEIAKYLFESGAVEEEQKVNLKDVVFDGHYATKGRRTYKCKIGVPR